MKIKGDCEAESFDARGNFKIDGLLNAGTIDVELLRHCEAKEIGGENITVKKTRDSSGFKKLIKFFMSNHNDQLTAEVIEGDHLYLEYTHAKVVRGNTIEIGPGCVIKRIEYKTSLEVDESAKVGAQEKRLATVTKPRLYAYLAACDSPPGPHSHCRAVSCPKLLVDPKVS